MHPAKRRRSVAKGDLHTDLKKASSASKAAMRTSHEEPIAKRFVPNAPAFVTTSPVILAFTLLSVAGYWRQVPNVPETVKAYVHVKQASPGFAPPPPSLPKSVALDIKGPVDLACKAAKRAWLVEARRAEFDGDEVSIERLNHLYKQGRKWYARHAEKNDVRPSR